MEIIEINASRPYEIHIESSLIDKIDDEIKNVYSGKKVFIITDDIVAKLYLDKVSKLLTSFEVESVIIPHGEASKSIDIYQKVCSELLDKNITRSDLLIALGGGVVGDLTGFVAATLYRGIPYVGIPTTLLSMIDSSIGGKTAIDFMEHKNIIGAFNQPRLVLIDPNVLKTLDERNFKAGYGEVIKHALLESEELFSEIERLNSFKDITEDIIIKNLEIKKKYVEADEFDQNQRMKLNLGHTFGHVIEMDYDLLHGEAVLSGLLCILDLGAKFHLERKDIKERLLNLYQKLGLNYIDVNYLELIPEIFYDKKNMGGKINFIMIRNIGQTMIYPIAEIQLCAL